MEFKFADFDMYLLPGSYWKTYTVVYKFSVFLAVRYSDLMEKNFQYFTFKT